MREKPFITLGTRGSPLAVAQTEILAAALKEAHPELAEDGAIAIKTITTSGDKIQDRALLEAGGKGLFIKEIEEALFAGEIDMAVHSMKDVPAELPPEGELSCILPREDPRDAFISVKYASLKDLPDGATLGTAGIRRKAFALAQRPDLKIVLFRGNVGTRLEKLQNGEADATFLAVAGLKRLGLEEKITAALEPSEILPAAGQGAIGVEIRTGDDRCKNYLAPLHCKKTALCIAAERGVVAVLDASCRTPIGAFATRDSNGATLTLRAAVATEDGTEFWQGSKTLPASTEAEAEKFGRILGQELRGKIPEDVFKKITGRA